VYDGSTLAKQLSNPLKKANMTTLFGSIKPSAYSSLQVNPTAKILTNTKWTIESIGLNYSNGTSIERRMNNPCLLSAQLSFHKCSGFIQQQHVCSECVPFSELHWKVNAITNMVSLHATGNCFLQLRNQWNVVLVQHNLLHLYYDVKFSSTAMRVIMALKKKEIPGIFQYMKNRLN
jgi:hypothetical protein